VCVLYCIVSPMLLFSLFCTATACVAQNTPLYTAMHICSMLCAAADQYSSVAAVLIETDLMAAPTCTNSKS
jgi:hypothetical protein